MSRQINTVELNGIHVWLEGGDTGDSVTLKNVNFSGSQITRAIFSDTYFQDCDFSEAHLNDSYMRFTDASCHFTNAEIIGATINLTPAQLQSTSSYKRKSLRGTELGLTSVSQGVSFEGFDLRNCILYLGKAVRNRQLEIVTRTTAGTNCDFTDARIEGLQLIANP